MANLDFSTGRIEDITLKGIQEERERLEMEFSKIAEESLQQESKFIQENTGRNQKEIDERIDEIMEEASQRKKTAEENSQRNLLTILSLIPYDPDDQYRKNPVEVMWEALKKDGDQYGHEFVRLMCSFFVQNRSVVEVVLNGKEEV